MSLRLFAQRYALAFVRATGGDEAEKLMPQWREIGRLFTESFEVRELFLSPVLRRAERTDGLAALGARLQWADPVRRTVELMLAHGRGPLIPLMAGAVAEQIDRVRGRVHLEIVTARPWSQEEQDRFLKQLFQGETRVDWRVDPTLVGGVRVRQDDLVWDGSIRRQLQRLERALTH